MDWLTSVPMAHRGLHNEQVGIIENSEDAFGAAIAAGYGMECDIQASSDGEAMVFHDSNLNRLTAASGPLRERGSAEIGALQLTGTKNTIQTLGELLEQIDGRAPLLVEIKKTQAATGKLEERTRQLLETYKGPAAIMSFNPQTVGWFAENAPKVPRGQLSMAFKRGAGSRRPWWQKFAARNLLINKISKPHFIGYDIQDLPTASTTILRKMGTPILTWTVKTKHHREIAEKHADNIIFEGFRPSLDRNASE